MSVSDFSADDDNEITPNTWGSRLWDQYDNIWAHTQRGLDFCDHYVRFTKDRILIEQEYSQKVTKLCQKYEPKKKDEDSQFSYSQAFVKILHELQSVANQHDIMGSRLSDDIVKPMQGYLSTAKQERKQLLQRASQMQANLQNAISGLEKAKESYQKSFMSMEKAYENHMKAEANDKLSRQEQKKIKAVYTEKTMACENSKQSYAAQREKANSFQSQHFYSDIPMVFDQLQRLDEERVEEIGRFLSTLFKIENDLIPIVQSCVNSMRTHCEMVDKCADSQLVIDRFCTGFSPPGDFDFEELISAASCSTKNLQVRHTLSRNTTLSRASKSNVLKGLFKTYKSEEVREDYGHLPPAQQVKRLKKKIDDIKGKLRKFEEERRGLQKLYDVYQRDPSMGDASSLDGRKAEIEEGLDRYNGELHKFSQYLSIAKQRLKNGGGMMSAPVHNSNQQDDPSDKSSNISSHTSSDQSNVVSTPQQTPEMDKAEITDSTNDKRHSETKLNGNDELAASVFEQFKLNISTTPNRKVEDRKESIHEYEGQNAVELAESDEASSTVNSPYNEVQTKLLGTSTAMYSFDPSALDEPYEHAVAIDCREPLYLLSHDMDGWIHVRKSDFSEGFVPTSYLSDMKFFSEENVYELAEPKDAPNRKAPIYMIDDV